MHPRACVYIHEDEDVHAMPNELQQPAYLHRPYPDLATPLRETNRSINDVFSPARRGVLLLRRPRPTVWEVCRGHARLAAGRGWAPEPAERTSPSSFPPAVKHACMHLLHVISFRLDTITK